MVFPFVNRFGKSGLKPNLTRKAIPVNAKRPETISEQVARLVRSSEFSRHVAAQGKETFEEADDFNIPDDLPSLLPNTPWQDDHDLAIVGAMEGNIVERPTLEQVNRSRDIVSKARNAILKRNSGTPATPPAISEDSSSESINNAEEESSS